MKAHGRFNEVSTRKPFGLLTLLSHHYGFFEDSFQFLLVFGSHPDLDNLEFPRLKGTERSFSYEYVAEDDITSVVV